MGRSFSSEPRKEIGTTRPSVMRNVLACDSESGSAMRNSPRGLLTDAYVYVSSPLLRSSRRELPAADMPFHSAP